MRYLATPSGPEARAAMSAGLLGCMTTPAQGNRIPEGALYACDNGKFGKGWPGADAWMAWLAATVDHYGAERCLWAVAPDVPMDAEATLAESIPWLAPIRALGIPVAFAAQDGSEADGLIPWDEIDVLFLAGSTEWKTSPAAWHLAHTAKSLGLAVHIGRVNSLRRMRLAEGFGCDTVDGTFLAYGPDTNLPRLRSWLHALDTQPSLFASPRPQKSRERHA
ncbi:hypothetical protein BIV57_13460 [Mangrovactinospora gilvigrisea]|uniref:Uncharacterized protein n=1 Tax=Mangrovactinospora gilvigrisea TaxID=1428644 RepID=A0A1J7BED0_9ACTN|nr:hypothetical protein [Mangrovactinospora gilvigrisea]OIV36990.1 hypothetical protein BIV57_13460 [Mangrovactinospora gilvigrisea]